MYCIVGEGIFTEFRNFYIEVKATIETFDTVFYLKRLKNVILETMKTSTHETNKHITRFFID